MQCDQMKFISGYFCCSTMWLGCQSRRFNCLFWRETRQRILGQKNLAVSGSGKGTRTRVDDATQESSRWQESREAVGGWTGERAVAAGQERGEQQELTGKNGGAVNTRH